MRTLLDYVRVRHPVGGRNDDFVTRVQNGQGKVEKALFATTGYQNLVGFVFQTVVPFELRDNRFLQCRRTIHRGVFGLAVADGLDGGHLDVFGGVEVRFAGAQANDVLAGRPEFRGFVGHGEGGRGLDRLYTAGKLKVQT